MFSMGALNIRSFWKRISSSAAFRCGALSERVEDVQKAFRGADIPHNTPKCSLSPQERMHPEKEYQLYC